MLLEHKHLIVRAEIHHPPCNPSAMDDWMHQLVQDIRMKVLMGSFSVYSGMPGNQGRRVSQSSKPRTSLFTLGMKSSLP
ncbi:MAG: hypothetical protein VXZ92_05865 [SAR324 cluster bacterium]|nr:hypothetical protein [SAR324 cluster bacterium]MEC8359294.1 hypothetical protein [SAR324 cluster bacterium]